MSFDFVEKVMTIGGTGNEVPTLQFYKRGFELNGGGESPSWQDIILSGNTALTLVNAKANGLNYLKLFGGTEQRNLPEGYTQVEYLESDGTQYIDTGVTGYTDIELDIKYRITQNNTAGYWAIYGRWDNDNSPNLRHIYDSSFISLFLCNNETGSTSPTISASSATPLNTDVVEIMNTDGWYINNTFYARSSTSVRTSNTNSVLLFNRYAKSENGFIGRVYYFVLKRAGTVLFNGVPCKRNSDNVLGMYDTVSGNFLTNQGTGTFTAGADVVPSPDIPMDIVCNNGVVKVNRNLYSTEYHDKTLSQADGVTTSTNTGVNVSGMVDCRTIKSFKITTISPQGSFRIFKYGADNTFINANSTGNIGDIVTFENNVGFFRIQYNYTRGNVGTEDVLIYNSAYDLNGIYTDGTTETVEITGKNLFDKNDIAYTNSTILADGSIISAENISVLDYIPVQPNTTYTYSSTTNSARAYNKRIVCFDANKNYIASIADTTGNPSGPFSITGTTPANTKYVRVACSNDQVATAQLEQGSTATTYKPYFNGGTATAEDLFKVGTYQDVQSVIDGGVTRNVGVKVLDGTEDWVASSTANLYSLDGLNNYDSANFQDGVVFCTHLVGVLPTTSGANMPDYSLRAGGASSSPMTVRRTIYIKYVGFSSVDDFKQWLSNKYANGTPVIIVYPLAEPTTESVTAQPLTTQAGTNIVEITQASIDNLGLEVSYKAVV